MIILYDYNGNEVGHYDTASDLYDDYPNAEIIKGKFRVKEP